MSYFPESLMPIIVKDESADSKGNSVVINAADFNKHSEEIRLPVKSKQLKVIFIVTPDTKI